MDYEEARAYAARAAKSGSILGLVRMEQLMKELGDVQENLRILHIAGTNGKGSVGAFLEGALIEAGFSVGRYTSPAVFAPLEVWRMDGKNISEAEYAENFTEVAEACGRMVQKGMEHPTIFEMETALAFLYFYRKKCDYALVEVGMGGASDATNIITSPVCSVITSVSMDHMQFLGGTLEEIARAKAGIIKEGCPVATVVQKPAAMRVIRQTAEERHAPFFLVDATEANICSTSPEKLIYTHPQLGTAELPLTERCQVENSLLAAKVLGEVLHISKETILAGFKKTVWRGRFEIVGRDPLFVIDGAHNEDAAQKLRETVENYFTNKTITYIIGVLADKEHEKILKIMLPLAARVYTVTPDSPRALGAKALAAEAEKYHACVTACAAVGDAVRLAVQNTPKDGVILAFGSLSYFKDLHIGECILENSDEQRKN